MYAIEVLPPALAERSLSRRHISIEAGLAPQAVSWLAAHGWAVTEWELRYRTSEGEFHSFARQGAGPRWRRGERWEDHAWAAAGACLAEISRQELRFAAAPLGEGPPLYVIIKAWAANPHLEAINALLLRHFPGQRWLDLTEETTHVPLMAALVRKSSRSFAAGQKLYVYDVHWGMGEKALVVGRFRRKQRWIRGHCPLENLDDFRPKIVQHPQVINALRHQAGGGPQRISAGIFWRFLPMPVEPEQP